MNHNSMIIETGSISHAPLLKLMQISYQIGYNIEIYHLSIQATAETHKVSI